MPENWTTNHAKFSFRSQDLVASRGDAMSDKLVGRFDVSPLFDVQTRTELFSVVETDSDQNRVGEMLLAMPMAANALMCWTCSTC